jgi:hypothetical protein
MDTINFSKLLLLLVEESCLWIFGLAISSGADTEVISTVSSASAIESTLPESGGTSLILVSEGISWGRDWVLVLLLGAAEVV